MAGFDAPYVPGWDCHGLPIEIKVDKELGGKKLQMRPIDVRAECRKYAQKFLDLQRQQFKRIGVFGRFDRPYATMNPQYESVVLSTFFLLLRERIRLQRPARRLLVHARRNRAGRSRSRIRKPHQPDGLGEVRVARRSRED